VWAAQGAPQVFVSTGTAGIIYSLNTANGALTTLISSPGADFEGMVVAPDNTVVTMPPEPAGTTHYLVYVCDTANSRVWRFDPNDPATLEKIYNGGALQNPQCGRITSSGDLVVSSTVAGSGLWIFPGVTNAGLGSYNLTPTQLVGVAGSTQGVAQKNTGDLLVVDSTNGTVVRTPVFPAVTQTFISGLSQPFGIARRGDGRIFVDTHGNKPSLVQYTAQGTSPTSCLSFKNNTPNFMQMALDNTLYVAVAANNNGTVRSINANTCQQNQSFAIPYPAVGIALPPTMTAMQNVTASNGTALVNFGYAAFQMNQISGNVCAGTVSVAVASPAAISQLIALTGSPATPAVNLGLDGFEAVFNTGNLSGCTTGNGSTTNFQMSHFLSPQVTNPELVVCDDANTQCNYSALSLFTLGTWPIGGYLPQDLTTGGSKSLKCNLFMANASNNSQQPGTETGTFCGFQSPLTNTFSTALGTWNSSLAATLSVGKSVPVKFKLGTGTAANACQSAPYITDANAILSVAQVADSKGTPLFVPIGLISNGSSGLSQPTFKGDNNNQYLFNWDSSSCTMPGGTTQICPKGTYSLTVTFLTNNTVNQTIYDYQTTLVVLK